jgi:hypothetical protein
MGNLLQKNRYCRKKRRYRSENAGAAVKEGMGDVLLQYLFLMVPLMGLSVWTAALFLLLAYVPTQQLCALNETWAGGASSDPRNFLNGTNWAESVSGRTTANDAIANITMYGHNSMSTLDYLASGCKWFFAMERGKKHYASRMSAAFFYV